MDVVDPQWTHFEDDEERRIQLLLHPLLAENALQFCTLHNQGCPISLIVPSVLVQEGWDLPAFEIQHDLTPKVGMGIVRLTGGAPRFLVAIQYPGHRPIQFGLNDESCTWLTYMVTTGMFMIDTPDGNYLVSFRDLLGSLELQAVYFGFLKSAVERFLSQQAQQKAAESPQEQAPEEPPTG